MGQYGREDILASAREHQVRFIRLQFSDVLPSGILKMWHYPSAGGKALNGEMMFDGSSVEGFVRIEDRICI